MKKRVSDKIVEMLSAWGVKKIYGVPGNTIDPLLESLHKQNQIEFILVRNEQAAAFAASMEAKLTGKIGVCLACQGPGAINLLNGLYDAAMDGAPVLAITGQLETSVLGTIMVQEINQSDLFSDVCCYNQLLVNAEQTVPVFSRAFRSALMKKGVAQVIIPSDILDQSVADSPFNSAPPISIGLKSAEEESLIAASRLISNSIRPCILYGIGATNATTEIIQLAELLKAPLVYTTRSKDLLASDNPYIMGGIGFLGNHAANKAVQQCDLLLVLGSSFAFTEYYPKEAKIIQIDNQLERIGLHAPISMGIAADCKLALQQLLKKLKGNNDDRYLQQCMANSKTDKRLYELPTRIAISKHRIHPIFILEGINKYAPTDTIFSVEVGESVIWANNYLKTNGKNRFVWSANLAALGFALPAGISAKLSYPNRCSVVLAGDFGFATLIADFITAVKYQAPIICIVLNNKALQSSDYSQGVITDAALGETLSPDYATLAKSMGGDGASVTVLDELDSAIERAFKTKVPYILDVYVEPEARPIPPVINTNMALAFAKSRFKRFFAKQSEPESTF